MIGRVSNRGSLPPDRYDVLMSFTHNAAFRQAATGALYDRFGLPADQAHVVLGTVAAGVERALRLHLDHPEPAFWRLLHQYRTSATPHRPLAHAAEDVCAMEWVDFLLGDDAAPLVRTVHEQTGVPEMTALGLTYFTAPMCVAFLKERIDEVGLTRALLPFLTPPAPAANRVPGERLRPHWPLSHVGPYYC